MPELNIDWAALHSAFQMNMAGVQCFLSLDDGRVLKLPPGDPNLGSVRADPQRYILIDAIPSRIQYQWLDEFIKSIEDETTRTRMVVVINGRGAFRRFKDVLLTLPEERRRWFEYRDQMMRQRIVEWVQEQGITPLNEPPWANAPAGSVLPMEPLVSYPGSFMGPEACQLPSFSLNTHRDIEALRDFLIEWSDQRQDASMPGPIELEELANDIAKHFKIKATHL